MNSENQQRSWVWIVLWVVIGLLATLCMARSLHHWLEEQEDAD